MSDLTFHSRPQLMGRSHHIPGYFNIPLKWIHRPVHHYGSKSAADRVQNRFLRVIMIQMKTNRHGNLSAEYWQ